MNLELNHNQPNLNATVKQEQLLQLRPNEEEEEESVTPFLKKTFEIVDDINTNRIISWSCSRKSFVVWDVHKFSADLLPMHFKHNNFSSFVRQLNTYRFRKIDSDRWEFANEGFQQGKRHLLKHITRRKQNAQSTDYTKHGIEIELDKLRTDHTTMRTEVLELRQQQENTQHSLDVVTERLHSSELKQKHLAIFMIKSLDNPTLLLGLIEKMKTKKALSSGEILKKRRLAAPDVGDGGLMGAMKTIDIDEEAYLSSDGKRLRGHEELAKMQYEMQALFSSDESGSPAKEEKAKNLETISRNTSSENFVLWEKLMEDDVIYEGEESAEKQQSDIV